MAGPDVFEAYFRIADCDHDGRISGAEAVAFFQGSGLPQLTLAKIWQFADAGQTGFLSKPEFFNALKLVTVAQSGRDLTPDLVQSALEGPAASRIPAPKIITPASDAGLQSQPFQSVASHSTKILPPQATGSPSDVKQGSVWPGTSSNVLLAGLVPPVPDASSASLFGNLGIEAWVKPGTPNAQTATAASSIISGLKKDKTSTVVIPAKLQDVFSDGEFKATPPGVAHLNVASGLSPPQNINSGTDPDKTGRNFPGGNSGGPAVANSGLQARDSVSTASTGYGLNASMAYDRRPSSSTLGRQASEGVQRGDGTPRGMLPVVNGVQPMQPAPIVAGPSGHAVVSAALAVPRLSVPLSPRDFGGEAPEVVAVSAPWPKMTRLELQRYSKMFFELDTDKDLKITGAQARDLFLGWQLPMEMLKRVWDLADEDLDGMLSLKEFGSAMYLIERFREGRSLPSVLPKGFYLEDSSLQVQAPSVGVTVPQSVVPMLDSRMVNQLSKTEQDSLTTQYQDAERAGQKVADAQKEHFDTQQKIDYYQKKLQELVLHKSRCDIQLMNITQRVVADSQELEVLTKRFDEKVRESKDADAQVLSQGEALNRIQRRKAELSEAVARLEQADIPGSLQTRADRIWSDVDELTKTLSTRCQQLGLRVPKGPQVYTMKYDDHWDKFHDEDPKKTMFDTSVKRNPLVSSSNRGFGPEQPHGEFTSSSHPHGKRNLGNPAARNRSGEIQGVFSEAEVFDWRDAYPGDSTKPQGHSHSKVSTSQDGSYDQRNDHRRYDAPATSADRFAKSHRENGPHDSPLFSSSPVHPKLVFGSDPHQDVEQEISNIHAHPNKGPAQYDDDPFVGMGPFGGGIVESD